MDTHNEIAGPETAMGQRLANLTKDIKVEGLDLNFKVYNVIDVNAFACGDGSVRVCGGLMKIMVIMKCWPLSVMRSVMFYIRIRKTP